MVSDSKNNQNQTWSSQVVTYGLFHNQGVFDQKMGIKNTVHNNVFHETSMYIKRDKIH